jgi:D-glycero-alpha-D-manno-heptose 1-phosphate guanylyltransferase
MQARLDEVTAVILAGGRGTRLRHLFPELPKPMIPVCGRPFVEWVVRFLKQQGIRRVLISTGHLGEIMEAHFAVQPVEDVSVTCVREREALGTGGGFLNAVEASREKPSAWLVLNGDSLVAADLASAVTELNRPETQGVILGVSMSDASRYGRVTFDDSRRLLRFVEKQPGAGVINAGIYCFKPSVLSRFPSRRPLSFENDVFPQLLADRIHLSVSVTDAPFLDIGTPESLALAESFIAQNFQSSLPA